MPTYDYRCAACQHEFEEFQSITDKPLKKCPECGGQVKRLLGTGAGIIFKGSGFYETDYKRKPVSSSKPAEKPADKAKDSASSSAAAADSSGTTAASDTAKTTEAKPAAPAPKKKG
jgi:putative FmdB family regulatory protein